jgi:hypothetical protein
MKLPENTALTDSGQDTPLVSPSDARKVANDLSDALTREKISRQILTCKTHSDYKKLVDSLRGENEELKMLALEALELRSAKAAVSHSVRIMPTDYLKLQLIEVAEQNRRIELAKIANAGKKKSDQTPPLPYEFRDFVSEMISEKFSQISKNKE